MTAHDAGNVAIIPSDAEIGVLFEDEPSDRGGHAF
jgi:hypothetical protein